MKILYGLAGEGLGHTMRSQVVLRHLVQHGHEVRVVASGRGAAVLAARGFAVDCIEGFTLRYKNGGVAYLRSMGATALRAVGMARHNRGVFKGLLEDFVPDVCISDFDSFAYTYGRWLGCPVLSFDHQHVLDRCEHPTSLVHPSIELARALVSAKLPGCEHYIVTSFFQPPVRPDCSARTSLVGPILRPEVAQRVPTRGDHVLVYQTAHGDRRLLAALEATPDVEFRVYGVPAQEAGSHIRFRPFSESGFLEDLASARGVVSNGGYTTLSEAVCLGKPVLAVPMRKHGEQQLNAAWLARLGLGLCVEHISAGAIRDLSCLEPRPAVPSGNRAALETIDRLLEAA